MSVPVPSAGIDRSVETTESTTTVVSEANIKDKHLTLQHKIQPAVKTNEMVMAQIGNYTAVPLIRG